MLHERVVEPASISVVTENGRWHFELEVGQFMSRMTFDRINTKPRLIRFDH